MHLHEIGEGGVFDDRRARDPGSIRTLGKSVGALLPQRGTYLEDTEAPAGSDDDLRQVGIG